MLTNTASEKEVAIDHLSKKLMAWLLLRSAALPAFLALTIGGTAAALGLGIMALGIEVGAALFLPGMVGFCVGLVCLPAVVCVGVPVLIISFWLQRRVVLPNQYLRRQWVDRWSMVATVLSCLVAISLQAFANKAGDLSKIALFLEFVFSCAFGFVYSIWSRDLFWAALQRRAVLHNQNIAKPNP